MDFLQQNLDGVDLNFCVFSILIYNLCAIAFARHKSNLAFVSFLPTSFACHFLLVSFNLFRFVIQFLGKFF